MYVGFPLYLDGNLIVTNIKVYGDELFTVKKVKDFGGIKNLFKVKSICQKSSYASSSSSSSSSSPIFVLLARGTYFLPSYLFGFLYRSSCSSFLNLFGTTFVVIETEFFI